MSKEKGCTERPHPFSTSDPDEIIYAPITEDDKPNYQHDWNVGAQVCTRCGLDLLDYLAYGLPCKKK